MRKDVYTLEELAIQIEHASDDIDMFKAFCCLIKEIINLKTEVNSLRADLEHFACDLHCHLDEE